MPKRTLLSYLPVSRLVRLKSPSLIERWESLAVYARQVPDRPQNVIYDNPLTSEWMLTAHREKINSTMVFFMKAHRDDVDAVSDLEPGDTTHALLTEYKVNTKVPFIVRHISSTHLLATEDGDLELASPQRFG